MSEKWLRDLDVLDHLQMPSTVKDRVGKTLPSAESGQPRSNLRRIAIVLVALAISVSSFIFAVRAFRPTPSEHVPAAAPVTNGSLAFLGGDFTGWLVQPDGSGLHEITRPDDVAYIVPVAFSPDGTQLAMYGYLKGHAGDYSIFVADADGTGLTDLTA